MDPGVPFMVRSVSSFLPFKSEAQIQLQSMILHGWTSSVLSSTSSGPVLSHLGYPPAQQRFGTYWKPDTGTSAQVPASMGTAYLAV